MIAYVLKRNGNWYQRHEPKGEKARLDAEIRLKDATLFGTKKEAEKHVYPWKVDGVTENVWKVQKVEIKEAT